MAAITIQPLTAARLDDYLHFFDHLAFIDNPHWASCYCYFYLADHDEREWQSRTGAENRAAMQWLIASNRAHGYLAYLDDEPVGWCHAGPRAYFTALQNDAELRAADIDIGEVGSIVCFIVARGYRQRGVATRLLDAACVDFKAQGLLVAEAYPRMGRTSDAGNHHGPLSMYLNAGFQIVREYRDVAVVRRTL